MSLTNQDIPMIDLILCLSQAVDQVSPLVADHHLRVAYIVLSLAQEMGLPEAECMDLAMAGALHDIGGLALQDRLDLLDFEINEPGRHGELGDLLIRPFRPLAHAARLIRHHHVFWQNGAGEQLQLPDGACEPVPPGSHLLHLADRVAVLIDPRQEVLLQEWAIRDRIRAQAGKMFRPEQVEAFCSLSTKEYFWLDTVSDRLDHLLSSKADWPAVALDAEDLIELARLFCRTIDFRSPFTSTHSSGVAAVAERLACQAGYSQADQQKMRVAGYLHDLGKLAVPGEILDKPARLTELEYAIVRHHAYLTDRILEPIHVLDTIRHWGALHHERLDGSGYPYHLSDGQIPLGARIMAVADVFVALTETRPYRPGMQRDEVLRTLRGMVQASTLESVYVDLLEQNYDAVDSLRAAAQQQAVAEYQVFLQS